MERVKDGNVVASVLCKHRVGLFAETIYGANFVDRARAF